MDLVKAFHGAEEGQVFEYDVPEGKTELQCKNALGRAARKAGRHIQFASRSRKKNALTFKIIKPRPPDESRDGLVKRLFREAGCVLVDENATLIRFRTPNQSRTIYYWTEERRPPSRSAYLQLAIDPRLDATLLEGIDGLKVCDITHSSGMTEFPRDDQTGQLYGIRLVFAAPPPQQAINVLIELLDNLPNRS
jgi:hypothetical protein